MPDFNINFGNAKPIVIPPDGNYTLIVSEYTPKEANKPESRSKGFNISLVFNVDDPDFSGSRVYHNLWVAYDNPWAAKLFFEALTGKDLESSELDLSDPDLYIGETVGAACIQENYTANNGQERTKLSVAGPDAFYTV